jgi:hypothetical protein
MGRAAVLVDPTSLAIQSTFTKNLKYPEDKTPLSGQSLILLSRWLECAPKYRLRSILKKLCEEQAIADEVFVAMTARDVEIAERELLESGECPDYHPSCLDLIREQNERELANIIFNNGASTSTGSTRGDLVIAEALKQKEIADDGAQTGGVARKRKAKDHNSDAEESDDEEYESDHPCGAVHKRVKIGHGGIILKEKKRMKSVESLDNASSKHDHCKIAKCKNCNEAYDLCFKDAACQYHPCKHASLCLVDDLIQLTFHLRCLGDQPVLLGMGRV